MSKYIVMIEIDIPERCQDCRFERNGFCILDEKLRDLGLDNYRPYWCLLNDAKKVNDE